MPTGTLAPRPNNMANMDCNVPVRRLLEPVLVAKIYNQPIVEQIPYSTTSLTLNNAATISSACSEMKPLCEDYRSDDDYSDYTS